MVRHVPATRFLLTTRRDSMFNSTLDVCGRAQVDESWITVAVQQKKLKPDFMQTVLCFWFAGSARADQSLHPRSKWPRGAGRGESCEFSFFDSSAPKFTFFHSSTPKRSYLSSIPTPMFSFLFRAKTLIMAVSIELVRANFCSSLFVVIPANAIFCSRSQKMHRWCNT